MAKIFKTTKHTEESNKKNGSSFWETVGGIALGAAYVVAAAASTQSEYNTATQTMKTIVPKYTGLRNRTIPASDWDAMERAERVFEQHARSMDGAADNAATIHAVLLANRKSGSSYYSRSTNTRQMSLAEAQTICGLYESKFGCMTCMFPKEIRLSDSEKDRIFQAAVVLRENDRSYDSEFLEAILARA